METEVFKKPSTLPCRISNISLLVDPPGDTLTTHEKSSASGERQDIEDDTVQDIEDNCSGTHNAQNISTRSAAISINHTPALASPSKDDCSCCSDEEITTLASPRDKGCGSNADDPHDDSSCCKVVEGWNTDSMERGCALSSGTPDRRGQTCDIVPDSEKFPANALITKVDPCKCCYKSLQFGAKDNITIIFSEVQCCNAVCCKTPPTRHLLHFWVPPTPSMCCAEKKQFQEEGNAHVEAERTLMLNISGMDCPACTPRVERALKAMGVSDIKVEYLRASLVCTYSTSIHTPEAIRKRLEEMTGFTFSQASHRLGERTIRFSYDEAGAIPSIKNLQTMFSNVQNKPGSDEQKITQISKTDFRLVVGPNSAKHIYNIIAGDKTTTPTVVHDVEDDHVQLALNDMKSSLLRFLVLLLCTIPVLVLAWMPRHTEEFKWRGAVSLPLATIVVVVGGSRIIPPAFRSVFVRNLDADVLISLSTLSAFIYSIVAYAYNVTEGKVQLEAFFETSSLLMTLVILGRLVSVFSRLQSVRRSVALEGDHGQEADFAVLASDVHVKIHPTLLDRGDVVLIRPNDLIPSDGVVIKGHAEVDEALLTGEASPVLKSRGTTVLAGSKVVSCSSQQVEVRLTKHVQENSLSEHRRLLQEARGSRAPVEDLTDLVAMYIVPVVLVVAAICLLVWTLVFRLKEKKSGGQSFVDALSYAITVLALSCPCALTLCVPSVVVVAKDVGWRRDGIIVKSAAALQIARGATHVVFDKTGTLSTGRLRVVKSDFLSGNRQELEGFIAALVSGVDHPVSSAIARHLDQAPSVELDGIEAISGQGILAYSRTGSEIRGGSADWCSAASHPAVTETIERGQTVFCVSIDGVLAACFALQDDLRPDAAQVVHKLLDAGIKITILSGDHQRAVDRTVEELGLAGNDEVEARGGCMPNEKMEFVRMAAWQDSCKDTDVESGNEKPGKGKTSVVLFVGDGTNDTTALSQADVGISFASGTSLALECADAVIISGRLEGVLSMISLSRQSFRRMVAGFAWSLLYNLLAVIFGSGMLVTVRVEPRWAGLGELASLIPVLLVSWSMRLGWRS